MTKRDLGTNLRALQAAYDDANRRLTAARETEKSTSRAYDARRRRTPMGIQTERARNAWAIALVDWAGALVAREAAKDRVRAERRDVDDTAMGALMGSERPVVHEADQGATP
ncbi:hypothetical protein [Actinomadura meridiana]